MLPLETTRSRVLRGQELRALRRRHHVSIYEVARDLQVAPATVSRWETGARKIHPAFARLLASYFEGLPSQSKTAYISQGGDMHGSGRRKANAHPSRTRIRRGV